MFQLTALNRTQHITFLKEHQATESMHVTGSLIVDVTTIPIHNHQSHTHHHGEAQQRH